MINRHEMKRNDVLLTFTGYHDPYTLGLIGQDEQPGPILSLISIKAFDQIILFSTPKTEVHTTQTKDALNNLYPHIGIEIREVPLADPTDYFEILKSLRRHFQDICESTPGNYYVAVASGTPQMHACWLMLVLSGEIPAHILNVRPYQYVSKDKPTVTDVDMTNSEFPVVRPHLFKREAYGPEQPDVHEIRHLLGIVGDHPTMKNALDMAATLAPSSAPILILGETGTGKELIARFIHYISGRAVDKFVPINCAAIPKELVESILFGHRKGAFTGALIDQTGKFDIADGGTLFLDELVDLPLSIQAKLLRVLQDGIIEPIGERKSHKVDVRIVAATNQDVRKAVRNGKFREDLYYRLNVGEISLPSLRQRKSDIPKIALHVLDSINASLKKPKRLTPDALSRLQGHSWPGNVRDLVNVLERSILLARKDILDADDLLILEPIGYADPLAILPEPTEGFAIDEYFTSVRKQLILRALELASGNQSEAARLLGITPQAVHKFLRKNIGLHQG